jgi:hypothetical protein
VDRSDAPRVEPLDGHTREAALQIQKTVFLSYRRANASCALAVFQDLTHNGFDVFFDFSGIGSGDFESVILGNIRARAHFLVLLTPDALRRCIEQDDWLRREIETALDTQRNIVPLMLDGFRFGEKDGLIGKLSALRRYNGLNVHAEYFSDAMTRLRERFLAVPLSAVIHPPSESAKHAAEEQLAAALTAGPVTEKELKEAEQPRYVYNVKIKYQNEIERIEGTKAEEPQGPTTLVVYDGSQVAARLFDLERWSRTRQAK